MRAHIGHFQMVQSLGCCTSYHDPRTGNAWVTDTAVLATILKNEYAGEKS